jgi:predicted small integral membrane protein
MSTARIIKIVLVGTVGLFGLLTGIDNIIDYPTNLAIVQHILSMDMLPRSSPLLGRAITSAALQRAAYDLIISLELLFGTLCLLGAIRLASAGGTTVAKAKDLALAGLGLGLTLYVFGFLVIGGEWFQMWQAGEWNMQQPAFRFAGIIGIILLFVALSEEN